MKKSKLLMLILLSNCIFTFSQNKKLLDAKPMFGPLLGVNLSRFSSLDLGIEYTQISKNQLFKGKENLSFWHSTNVSNEFQFGKQYVNGLKAGSRIIVSNIDSSIPPMGLGLTFINYSGQKKSVNVLRPTFVVSYLLHELAYGYTIVLSPNPTHIPINKHVVEYRLRIYPLFYGAEVLFKTCCSTIF
jgi:hypothetical protein